MATIPSFNTHHNHQITNSQTHLNNKINQNDDLLIHSISKPTSSICTNHATNTKPDVLTTVMAAITYLQSNFTAQLATMQQEISTLKQTPVISKPGPTVDLGYTPHQ